MMERCIVCQELRQCSQTRQGFVCAEHFFERTPEDKPCNTCITVRNLDGSLKLFKCPTHAIVEAVAQNLTSSMPSAKELREAERLGAVQSINQAVSNAEGGYEPEAQETI